MSWIFNKGVSCFCILSYSVLFNGLVGCVMFGVWKCFERLWKDRGAYELLYRLLKTVILLFLLPLCWLYVTFGNYEFDTGVRSNWYPWISRKMAGILLLLFVVWLWGAVLSMKRYMKERRCLRNLKVLGRKVKEEEWNAVRPLIPSELLGTPVPILVCQGIASPMAAGFFHKSIYIPDRAYDRDTFALLLSHELTHIRHRDLFFKNLCAAVTIIYWFCPFLQEMFWKYDCWSEVFCDMQLCMGKGARWSAKEYYTILINEIEKNGTQNLRMSSALYETEKTVKWRVESMKHYHKMQGGSRRGAYAWATVFLLSVPLTIVVFGNAAGIGMREIYDLTLTEIEESTEQYNKFMDSSLEQYEEMTGEEELVVVPMGPEGQNAGSEVWDVQTGTMRGFSEVTLEKGESVMLGVDILSGDAPVNIGLLDGSVKRYVPLRDSGRHYFEIKEEGVYQFYVENKGEETITAEFTYYYIW